MPAETAALIPLTLAAVAGIVWAVRVEGRVNTLTMRHDDMREDLTYIRQRIDQALNNKH